jgi:hypothetical protein
MIGMRNFLSHLLLPNRTNNYRPRILHHHVLVLLIFFFFTSGFLLSFIREKYPSVLGTYSNITANQLLDATNQKRQENGLSPLTLNDQLTQAASNKGLDMFAKNYWAHFAPDGTTPWSFIKASGYSYTFAGENLARGFYNASDVVNAWMNSPEHRKNMLSPNYQNIGFSAQTGKLTGEDTVLVVEMLGSQSLAAAPKAQEPVQKELANGSPSSNQPAPAAESNKGANPPVLAKQSENANKLVDINNLPVMTQKPLINSQVLSLNVARGILFLFVFLLVLDMVIIERQKILRFVGHNLDHVLFLGSILLIIIVLARGSIL